MDELQRFEASRSDAGRYRMLVESITDYAIYMLDLDGKVTNWNAGAQRFKGYTPGEIIGEHFSRFYTKEDRDTGLPQQVLDIAAREGKFEGEGWRVRKDGSHFWAHVVIDPIRDPSGELVGYAKITRDLTERMQAQQEIEQARETLLQAQKMESIGQLTGGIAHDFNNLLMAAMSSLTLLRKRLTEDSRGLRLLDNAMQAAERGAALTRRMLVFGRRQELTPCRLDIPALVTGMTDMLDRSLGSAVEIETRFPLRLHQAIADANQLEMALLNLVVNARDAMPDGGVITISARDQQVHSGDPTGLEPGAYVSLSVADRGSGMDAKTLARAREPFFTTKGVGKGTGLGLSMVHGLAEQSGGRLLLESSPGQGTTAEVWLPATETEKRHSEAPVSLSEEQFPVTSPLKILAVDDDALVLMNTTALLEDLGHKPMEAYSGEEALEIFRHAPDIDLVITDQAMPRMTGVQLVDALRKDRPGVPVIIATGYGELPPGIALNVSRLAKPFSQSDLARSLAAIFPAAPDGEK